MVMVYWPEELRNHVCGPLLAPLPAIPKPVSSRTVYSGRLTVAVLDKATVAWLPWMELNVKVSVSPEKSSLPFICPDVICPPSWSGIGVEVAVANGFGVGVGVAVGVEVAVGVGVGASVIVSDTLYLPVVTDQPFAIIW